MLQNLIGKEMENKLSGWIKERQEKRESSKINVNTISKELTPFKQLTMKVLHNRIFIRYCIINDTQSIHLQPLINIEIPKRMIPDYR